MGERTSRFRFIRPVQTADLRRALAMVPRFGLSDVLGDLRLDRRTEPLEVRAPGLEQVRELIGWARRHEEARWAGAAALMALMGLRLSEVDRLRVGDLRDGLLHVGAAEAKNEAIHTHSTDYCA